MKILVINGSPTGQNSITLQTIRYIQKYFPDITWEVLDAGQKIRQMEKDFSACSKALSEADLILFCYPVYTFLAPAQLHRFIELMKEQGLSLNGKYATQLTTSKHFYDTTAHQYIEDNCKDLGLICIPGLSADMEDLLKDQGQEEALAFFRFVLWNMDPNNLNTDDPDNIRIALVTDTDITVDNSLNRMIELFRQNMAGEVSLINLADFPFAGGCLGCFHCASDGTCIYKDGFDRLLREQIQTADAIVYAYTIKDHSMGYRFKLYDDRQFCNGHRTVTMGKPVGYLVSGDLDREYNLQTLMQARAQVGGNFLAGIATDQSCNNPSGIATDQSGNTPSGIATDQSGNSPSGIAADQSETEAGIWKLTQTLTYAIRNHYQPPKNFYGVGGLKIFRDLIWQMQGLMREDHRFYKKHGFYDFPQKHKGRVAAMYLVGGMMSSKRLQKKIGGRMTEGMLMPYKKVLKKAGVSKN